MHTVTRWLGWLVVILPLHMIEQLLTGLDELATLRRVLAVYFGWFTNPDYGIVVLVTLVATLVNYLAYLIAKGGRGRLVSLGVFGFLGVNEIHHLVETVATGRYTPGTLTAIPYVVIGALLIMAVVREWRDGPVAAEKVVAIEAVG
jgi:uncharacterized membrane protein YeaQ/YmgE (transglycosylase-associated protein family)